MEFIDAEALDQALGILTERREEATILAGGTDIMVGYLRGESDPAALLHIRRIPGLRGVSANDGTDIGALTTHWDLVNNADIVGQHRSLAEAAATVGGRQTQNVGTVAGNLVNASPAADLAPPLLIGNAEVTLTSSGGERRMPLADFLTGRKTTARRPDELMTSISLDSPAPHTGEAYLKIGRRSAMEVAIVGLAARVTYSDSGTVTDARVAVCSVAPVPFRATSAEARLVGTELSGEDVTEAARLLEEASAPIDDPRASASYRRRTLRPLLERSLASCRERAGLSG